MFGIPSIRNPSKCINMSNNDPQITWLDSMNDATVCRRPHTKWRPPSRRHRLCRRADTRRTRLRSLDLASVTIRTIHRCSTVLHSHRRHRLRHRCQSFRRANRRRRQRRRHRSDWPVMRRRSHCPHPPLTNCPIDRSNRNLPDLSMPYCENSYLPRRTK